MSHYMKRSDIKDAWNEWTEGYSDESWHKLCNCIYTMCSNISLRYKPRTPDERNDLIHYAFERIINKVNNFKTKTKPYVNMVDDRNHFNYLTTAIINELNTLKTKESRHKNNLEKLRIRKILNNDHIQGAVV